MLFFKFLLFKKTLLQSFFLLSVILVHNLRYLLSQSLDIGVTQLLTLATFLAILVIRILFRIKLLLKLVDLVLEDFLVLSDCINFFLWCVQFELHQFVEFFDGIHEGGKVGRVDLI